MRRRDFLKSAGLVSAGLALSNVGELLSESAAGCVRSRSRRELRCRSRPEPRSFGCLLRLSRKRRIKERSRTDTTPRGEGRHERDQAGRSRDRFSNIPGRAKPVLTLTSRVQTRNYRLIFSRPGNAPRRVEPNSNFLQPTKLLPSDGIVKATATEITKGANTDVEKASAIYEWIVDKTFRDPKTRAAAAATSGSCWSPEIWAVNALT